MSSKKHRNGHISKRHFGQESITKSQLLHFSMNLSETFSIDVNMDFANNLGSGILVKSHQKYCEPKIKNGIFLYLRFFAKPLSKFCANPYLHRFWKLIYKVEISHQTKIRQFCAHVLLQFYERQNSDEMRQIKSVNARRFMLW